MSDERSGRTLEEEGIFFSWFWNGSLSRLLECAFTPACSLRGLSSAKFLQGTASSGIWRLPAFSSAQFRRLVCLGSLDSMGLCSNPERCSHILPSALEFQSHPGSMPDYAEGRLSTSWFELSPFTSTCPGT